jgi:hypothetical protein
MASYAEVEAALAQLHSASPEVQRGAFRGRLKHLQTLGVPLGANPGKGKRIDYTRDQIIQIALALELAEFGIDPKKIAKLVRDSFEGISKQLYVKNSLEKLRANNQSYENNNKSNESLSVNLQDTLIMIPAEILSDALNQYRYEKEQLTWIVPKGLITRFSFEDYPRVMVINLSEIIRRLAPLLSSMPGKE